MQERELRECTERIFIEALMRVYQRDALIDLYHALRESWCELARSSEQAMYVERLTETVQRIRSLHLYFQQNRRIIEADLSIIQEIEDQLTQLEEQAHL